MSLQPLLRQPFARDTYRTILQDILPSGTLQMLGTPQLITAKCDDVTCTHQLGSIELPDGNTIALFEVHVSDQVKLARNRVALRNFVARFIDEARTTAVLAVFHQPGKPDWRLTYACKRSQLDEDTLEITSTQTAPRRFTFLLGGSEPCRTAAGRLKEIQLAGETLKLEDIEKAFSIERLNKDFFKDYKKHYETFIAHLLASENAKATRTAFGIAACKDKAGQDKADKPIRDFVKRLLGRLVFLHFLQKKGWMGCPAKSKVWTGGDPDFLSSYFTLAESKKDAHRFHSRWLIPLFFDALNNAERPGDLFKPTGTRIPYLNGGLFETDAAPLHALDFPAPLFRALLDFFGQYHFTIDENDPEDHEVGIDPEMLGHIFENLLEDNKDKGAYYTPKAIVSYMARQSLLYYLQTHLGENAELGVLLNEKDFTRLDKNGFVNQNAKRIADLLDAVKICDPAIGSGAFPIGLLHEILWTRLTLNWELNTSEERAKLKRRIIQNSIHGVDLDPGAVEIARLRFWLALVVDEDQPRPLPNLDYKIHRADSLVEYIRGESVHLGKVSSEDKRTHGAIQSLIAAKASLFTAQRLSDKRAARFALYRALAEVAVAEFTWLRNDMGLIAKDAERAAQLDHGLKEFGHRAKLIDSAVKESAKTQDQILTGLRAWFDDDQNPTFLWQLHFGEVFALGGFDIVIGNPPYGVSLPVRHRLLLGSEYPEVPDVEAAYYFLSKVVSLARKGGVACLIIPNTWLANTFARQWRQWLLRTFRILEVSDCSDVELFQSASVRNSIPLVINALDDQSVSDVLFQRFNAQSKITDAKHVESLALASCIDNWLTLFTQSSPITALIEKMKSTSQKLASFADISQGLIPYDKYRGHDVDTIRNRIWHSDVQVDKIWRPELQGKEMDRYKISWRGKNWIKYGPWLAAPRDPRFFRDPRILIREITNPRILAAYTDKEYYNTPSIINITGFRDQSPFFLLAVLNSGPLSFFHIEASPKAKKGLFPKILVDDVRKLPIPPASADDKARLSKLAEACSAAAQRGDDETLAVHEAEIDQIVYRLFDLTPDEIALIESALATSRTTIPKRRRASS